MAMESNYLPFVIAVASPFRSRLLFANWQMLQSRSWANRQLVGIRTLHATLSAINRIDRALMICRRMCNAFMIFAVSSVTSATIQGEENLDTVLRSGIAKAINSDERRYVELDMETRSSNGFYSLIRHKVAFSDSGLYDYFEPTDGTKGVCGWNRNYKFEVNRASPDKGWLLLRVDQSFGSAEDEERGRMNELFRDAEYRAGHIGILDALNAEKTDIAIRRLPETSSLIEVSLVSKAPVDPVGAFGRGVDSFVAVVDTEQSFRVVRYRLNGPSLTTSGEFEYVVSPSGKWSREFTRRETVEIHPPSGLSQSVNYVHKYRVRDDYVPPDAKFTLTDYGLPEPHSPKPPGTYRTQPWLYYFAGGVLLVAVGAFFVYRTTRRTGTA